MHTQGPQTIKNQSEMENRPNPKEIRIRNTKIHFERRSISPSLSLSHTGKIGCSDTLSESSSLSGSAGTGSHASAARMASWRQRSCGTSPTIRRWDVVVVLSCWVGVGPWFSMGWDYSNGERVFVVPKKCMVMGFNMFGSMLEVGKRIMNLIIGSFLPGQADLFSVGCIL